MIRDLSILLSIPLGFCALLIVSPSDTFVQPIYQFALEIYQLCHVFLYIALATATCFALLMAIEMTDLSSQQAKPQSQPQRPAAHQAAQVKQAHQPRLYSALAVILVVSALALYWPFPQASPLPSERHEPIHAPVITQERKSGGTWWSYLLSSNGTAVVCFLFIVVYAAVGKGGHHHKAGKPA